MDLSRTPSGSLSALDVSLVALGIYILKRYLTPVPTTPLPPGPKPLPLIGNLLDWPLRKEWETFTKWSEQYGKIVYCNLMGQHVVILNDAELAVALLERKGAIYSDRPEAIFAGELVGWKDSLPFSQYNERLKTMRTMLAKTIGTKAQLEMLAPMEEVETQRFLRRVIDEPHRLQAHIRKLAGAVILNVSHGYQVQEGDDPMIFMAEKAVEEFSQATTPGSHIVDIIPALNKLPAWFPGTGFRQTAMAMRKTRDDFLNIPHGFVKRQLAEGVARPSFVGDNLNKHDITPEEDDILKWAAAAMYGGGTDTTVSAIYTFFLAMTLYPEAQASAQTELDAILGDRIPTFADREALPYVDALVKEVLRWGSVAPQGGPHTLREDDVHDGYLIPKNSIMIPNVWKFTHDARTYADPMVFKPERFIATPTHAPEADPKQFVFGFGRRICPGLHLADASVWLACAQALAVLSITKEVSAQGKEIVPVVEYVGQLITHPREFECAIKPRSAEAEALVRAVADAST